MDHRTSEIAETVIGHHDAPMRIQLSRSKGWRLPANAMKVDRATRFGNPYRIGEPMDMKIARRWGWNISPAGQKLVCKDAAEAVARFCHCLRWDEAIHPYVREQLGGRNLACWCALDVPCHADILLRISNSTSAQIALSNAIADAEIIARAAEISSQIT
jgi:hypothetical protein